jgi:hypothetical protein
MPADPFTLRQADQARTDFAIIEDELEAIHKRLSQLPTRNEVWRAAMLGMLGGAVAAVTLIEAFARACNSAMATFWSLTAVVSLFALLFIITR